VNWASRLEIGSNFGGLRVFAGAGKKLRF